MRETVRAAAPEGTEVISYGIPAFRLNGILVYFAAFKNHTGLLPPVRGDCKLVKAASRYAGEKGNLRFPLDQPVTYELIKRIALHRAKQNPAKRNSAKQTPKTRARPGGE